LPTAWLPQLVKTAGTAITGNLNTGTPFSQIISPDITDATGDKPKAYLNIVFFDSLSRQAKRSGNALISLQKAVPRSV
jgi:hypothetical protein